MKTMAWTLIAAVLIAAPAAAQRPDAMGPGRTLGGPAMGEAPITWMVELALERRNSLGLVDEQVRSLEAMKTDLGQVNAQLREDMAALREDAAGDRGVMRDRMQAFRENVRDARVAQRERFDDILSEQQRDRLAAMMRPRRGVEARPGPDGRRPDVGRRRPGPGAVGGGV